MKRPISIVVKTNYRSVTAQKPGVHVHTHSSTRLNLFWNITCVISYRSCIERAFISKEEWKKFYTQLGFPCLDGICVCVCVCVCVRGGIKPVWDWKLGPCL